jgi:SAM-dependent methyltransferase
MNMITKANWPYNEVYAEKYDDIWRKGKSAFLGESNFNIEVTGRILKDASNWLDAGCGTGYFLSQFPGVKRAGFDLTPAMLDVAAKANPDAMFFKQHDLRVMNEEWKGKWDFVSTTGMPWCYLNTMDEIELCLKNLVSYVAPGGKLMLEPLDISDLLPIPFPQYYTEKDLPEHVPVITGVIWSLKENGVFHNNMIFPSIDHWIRWLSEYFLEVEILACGELSPPAFNPRRLFVCSKLRPRGDQSQTKIIDHPYIVTPDYKVKFVTKEEKQAYDQKRMQPPGLMDLPFSYLLSKFRPWTLKFWKTLYIVSREKMKG